MHLECMLLNTHFIEFARTVQIHKIQLYITNALIIFTSLWHHITKINSVWKVIYTLSIFSSDLKIFCKNTVLHPASEDHSPNARTEHCTSSHPCVQFCCQAQGFQKWQHMKQLGRWVLILPHFAYWCNKPMKLSSMCFASDSLRNDDNLTHVY